jgi:hypothetical protein
VQRPVNNAAAAEEVVKAVIETLSAQTLLALSTPPSTTQDTAVRWSCVSAVLRCAGWLVAARQALAVPPSRLDRALMSCMWFSTIVLNTLPPVGPDLLRSLLQPTAGSHVPGGWVLLGAVPAAVVLALGAVLGIATPLQLPCTAMPRGVQDFQHLSLQHGNAPLQPIHHCVPLAPFAPSPVHTPLQG